MENGYNDYASTMNGPIVGPLDQSKHARSPNDLMTRRLKNRERQRRYRARKRLEADRKKASDLNQSTPPQEQLQLLGAPNSCVTRVLCQRKWKRDARNACGPITSNTTITSGNQVQCLSSGVHSRPPLESEIQSINDNGETPRSTLSRRHWKAEARNKKN